MPYRPVRTLNDQEKEFFLGLSYQEISKTLLQNLFASTYDMKQRKRIEPKYNTYDLIKLKANDYFNKEAITTTCGLFIFNKRVLEKHYLKRIGYQNEAITDKQFKKLNTMLSGFTYEGPEEYDHYIDFLNVSKWLGETFNTEICASMSLKSCQPLPAVEKKKKELLKKYDKEIKEGRMDVIDDITKQLLEIAKEELKDDPSLELYESGARGSFDNAYRRMMVMVGPVFNASKGEYDIITNSLYDGYTKEQIDTTANNTVSVFYPKAIGSGEAGYLSKQINAAFQTVVLGEEDSDCGNKHTRDITLTPNKINSYLFCNMMEGRTLVPLTPENKDKYVGKTVKMRVATDCTADNPCAKCMGTRYYRLGIKNMGLTVSKMSGVFLNGKMKGSHDTTVRMDSLTLEEMIE